MAMSAMAAFAAASSARADGPGCGPGGCATASCAAPCYDGGACTTGDCGRGRTRLITGGLLRNIAGPCAGGNCNHGRRLPFMTYPWYVYWPYDAHFQTPAPIGAPHYPPHMGGHAGMGPYGFGGGF
jgi:hypothetical protein